MLKKFTALAASIAIVLSVITLVQVSSLKKSIASEELDTEILEEANDYDVAATMGRLQVYMNKLYFAGKSNNLPLYKFYYNEMNELMEKVEEAKVVSNSGLDVSGNIKSFGLQSMLVLDKRITEEGFKNFDEHYMNLVSSCNSCHKISQKGIIVIKKPTSEALGNQDFSIVEGEVADLDGD